MPVNPISHWKFDEASGTVATDSGLAGKHGTLVNGPARVTGQVGNALSFDGSNDRVEVSSFTPPSAGTLAFWVFPSTANNRILGSDDAFEARLLSTRRVSHNFFAAGNEVLDSETTIPLNSWSHLAFTWNTSTARMEIYINGTLNAATNRGHDPPPTATLSLGTRTGSSPYFKGTLDEVVLYDRVLNPTDIQDLALLTPVPPPPPDMEAPTSPQNLSATPQPNAVTLFWNASTDNVAVTGYTVFRDGTATGNTASTNYTDTGLAASTTFQYYVVSRDLAGNTSVPSTPISVTTLDVPPPPLPGVSWGTKTPAEVGLSQVLLDQFRLQSGNQTGVIIKDGYLVYSWGNITSKFDWASAGKPVTSTMLLFAIREGKLPGVHDLIKDWSWSLLPKDESMTFFHLANMMSGYAVPEVPGTAWAYNDYATALYNKTLFERVFAEGLPDAAVRNATRLGILQFQDGTLLGPSRLGFGLNTSARDFARIGWFWLNKGNWNGVQILPSQYFDDYIKGHIPSSLPQSVGGINDYLNVSTFGGGTNQTPLGPGAYGFNLWHNPNQETWPDIPADVYQANGHWNKEVLTVLPGLRMVAVWIGLQSSANDFFSPMNDLLTLLVDAAATP